MRGAALALLLGAASSGCGEVERADLVVLPRKDDYVTEIQPLFATMGCSAGTRCHSVPQGNLRIIVTEPNAAELEENYQSAKGKSDLRAPDASPLIADLLFSEANPQADHNPACWKSRESCAYRKLRAWIAWSGDDDPRPREIDCQLGAPGNPDPCADPAVLDACCFRR